MPRNALTTHVPNQTPRSWKMILSDLVRTANTLSAFKRSSETLRNSNKIVPHSAKPHATTSERSGYARPMLGRYRNPNQMRIRMKFVEMYFDSLALVCGSTDTGRGRRFAAGPRELPSFDRVVQNPRILPILFREREVRLEAGAAGAAHPPPHFRIFNQRGCFLDQRSHKVRIRRFQRAPHFHLRSVPRRQV